MLSAMGVPPPMFSAGDASPGNGKAIRRLFLPHRRATFDTAGRRAIAETGNPEIGLSFSGRFFGGSQRAGLGPFNRW